MAINETIQATQEGLTGSDWAVLSLIIPCALYFWFCWRVYKKDKNKFSINSSKGT